MGNSHYDDPPLQFYLGCPAPSGTDYTPRFALHRIAVIRDKIYCSKSVVGPCSRRTLSRL